MSRSIGGGSYSHEANGNVTHDALAGLDIADGTRISAERGDGTGR